jgi:hypothetical protein
VYSHGSDYLTTDDLVKEFRFPSRKAAWEFLRRRLVPVSHLGKKLLVRRCDMEAAMSRGRHAKQRMTTPIQSTNQNSCEVA